MAAAKQFILEKELSAGSQLSSRKKPVLLLVEDDSQMRHIFLLLVKRLEAQVMHAANAEEGLMLARDFIPVAIITDINLPGLNGLQFIECLKRNPITSRISIVAWSSNSTYRQAALAAGAVDFINKSDPGSRMLKCLQEILGRN